MGATLRTIEAEISYKAKNNEARPKFTGSYKKKRLADVTLKVSDGVFAFPVLLSVTACLAQNVTLYT